MKTRNLAYWLCQIFGWGIYSVIGILATAASHEGPMGSAFLTRLIVNYAIFFVTILALTHALRFQIHKRQWLNLPFRKSAPKLAAGAVAVGLCATLQVIAVDLANGGSLSNRVAILSLCGGLIGASVMWTLLYIAISATRRTLEMRMRLGEAQLRALENQVNPHFLFNSLNTIRGMIVEDATLAQDMVTRLANILRYNLQRERTSTVSLEQEIEIVADYLAIESIRFDDRLTVRLDIQPAAAHAQVPSMLVQTLVENAVKHGIAARNEGGEILIRASIVKQALVLEILNTGQLSAPREGATQIGLSNARERLRLLYGEHASLRLENRDALTVAAMVSIPA